MPLDARYVTTVSLDEYFVDPQTGAPLANGLLYFFEDDQRTTPKNVFQLVNMGNAVPPNYQYVALPNPINLNATGMPVDNNGNPVAIYYFPFDNNNNVQLYFVSIRNSSNTQLFVRQGWPNTTAAENPAVAQGPLINALSNPQFALVNFISPGPTVINIGGAGTTTYNIAPDWILSVTTTGAGTVSLTQNAIAGSAQVPGNSPYTLIVTTGGLVQGLFLRQRLLNNPNIFSPANGGVNGYISASILLNNNSAIQSIQYVPNGQPAQNILANVLNNSGFYAEFSNTIQLTPAANPSTGATGYVDIIINLRLGTTEISNVQIIGLSTNVQNILWQEYPVNRQIDQLFNYYNPLLQFKPIKSYLVGWDFPLNPAQLGTVFGPVAGANTSFYTWDQTIVFQQTTNGVTTAAAADGSLVLTAAANTRLAIVQYLEATIAVEILFNTLSSMLNGFTNQVGGISTNISLWYTTGTLPSVNGGNSIVATLNADGSVATTHAGTQPWVQIARGSLGAATFNLAVNGNVRTNYGFSNWLDTTGGSTTATFFAIVVGFGQLNIGNTITLGSVSLVPGQIPTNPAPQTLSEAVLSCQRYYEKSFSPATIPADGVGDNTGDTQSTGYITNAAGGIYFQSISFKALKSIVPTITLYNPHPAATAGRYWNYDSGNSSAAPSTQGISQSQFHTQTNGNQVFGDRWGVHWTADARLGL